MPHLTHPPFTYDRQPQHRDHPTLIRIVRGFFNVPQNYQHSRNCETGPPAYHPYPRRLESLTICRWNYKGSTFLLSYLKTLSVGPVGVSNSRPPTSQPGAQPSEPPVRGKSMNVQLCSFFPWKSTETVWKQKYEQVKYAYFSLVWVVISDASQLCDHFKSAEFQFISIWPEAFLQILRFTPSSKSILASCTFCGWLAWLD